MQRGGGALRRPDGSVLAEFEPDAIAARYGAPLVAVDRGELSCGDARRPGRREAAPRFSVLLDLNDGTLRFADGTRIASRAGWPGADGLRSIVGESLGR